ncbi:hypothetical protein LshimejAT787_0501260 [Lyophyllum shimeji]|uniref:Uncharacterized protein n=1 Tax=Lyophyllum shimeji TaxID=47721 RepID=A0A9P3UPG1_LYOSH|nr:hypothetical protein LshimejAT787_0501260 [Lyophyllum shimeji]
MYVGTTEGCRKTSQHECRIEPAVSAVKLLNPQPPRLGFSVQIHIIGGKLHRPPPHADITICSTESLSVQYIVCPVLKKPPLRCQRTATPFIPDGFVTRMWRAQHLSSMSTFGHEVDLFWVSTACVRGFSAGAYIDCRPRKKKRWTLAKILFLWCRYFSIVLNVSDAIVLLRRNPSHKL